jgi:hypothetical protein
MTLFLRVLLVVVLSAIVLAISYVVVTDPGSGTDVTARGHRPPVHADVGSAVKLGRGHAVMASGPAGLWVARQPPTGSPGEVERIDTSSGAPEHAYQVNILPQGIAVGRGVIWVLGTKPNDGLATLLRIDPSSGRVEHSLHLVEPPSCATEKFASCDPVATADGVWVPLLDEIVHVNRSGMMADRTVQLDGHVWDLTGSTGQLWALAETAIYRITERTGNWLRIGLKKHVGVGVQSNHVAADVNSVWVSSFPRGTTTNPGRLTRIDPVGPAGQGAQVTGPQVTVSRIYPGAGALALVDGGLWVARFDGQGELDRLNAATGALTGPFLPMPDDPTVLAERGDDLWVLSFQSSGNIRTVTKVTLTAAAH